VLDREQCMYALFTEAMYSDSAFAGALATTVRSGPLARSRTVVGNFRGQDNKKDKRSGNSMKASDVSWDIESFM
jgi:hypothetical protein